MNDMKMNGFFTKTFVIFFAAFILLIAAGCNGNQNGMRLDEVGVFLPLDESYKDKGIEINQIGSGMTHFPCAMITFSDEAEIDKIFNAAGDEWNSLSEEEEQNDFLNKLYADLAVHQKLLAQILVIPDAEYEELLDPANENADIIKGFNILGKKFGNTYLYDLPENNSEGMSDEERALFEECSAAVTKAVKQAKMIEIKTVETDEEDADLPAAGDQGYSASVIKHNLDFETSDLDGNTITKEFFSRKRLTVVNVWGTFCGPCIKEMPELAEWSKSMDSDVQLLGIVCDVTSENDIDGVQEAKDILTSAGADFTNILASESVSDFIAGIQYVPTTFLVDSYGNVVSEMIVGADVEKYKTAVDSWLSAN